MLSKLHNILLEAMVFEFKRMSCYVFEVRFYMCNSNSSDYNQNIFTAFLSCKALLIIWLHTLIVLQRGLRVSLWCYFKFQVD